MLLAFSDKHKAYGELPIADNYLNFDKITIKTIHKQINMTLEHKKNVFIELGKFISQFSDTEIQKKEGVLFNDLYFDALV